MTFLWGLAVASLIALSALGLGQALLSALRLATALRSAEARPAAFALGVGCLGWLAFFPALLGLVAPLHLFMLLVPGWLGLLLPQWRRIEMPALPRDPWVVAGLILLGLILALELVEAAAPPADADTLAYHFALPQLFLREGHLVFVPRALDGAIPLLLHMTYLVALGSGGETALTLWATFLGWGAAWLLYAVGLRFLPPRWALGLALLFLTTPAVIFAAGSGQIELRLALFASLTLVALAEAAARRDLRFALLAGLAAGCYVGAKYTGLIFAGSCGLVLLLARGGIRRTAAFGAASLLAGGQWYLWNWLQSGDPVFPALYGWLGAKDDLWSAAADAFLKADYFPIESPAPRTLLWLVLYPFAAMLDPIYEAWDAGRTGPGPLLLLLLPFALAGAWRGRAALAREPLSRAVPVILLFYAIWFLSGVSQRVRHLLPFYPLLLVLASGAALRWAAVKGLTRPLAAGCLAILLVQAGGAAVFARNYLYHLLSGETRQAFLERNVARYQPVPWINANLGPGDRLLLTQRQLVYHIAAPTYTAQPALQHLVDLLPGDVDPKRFLGEIRRLGITHILVLPNLADFAAGERFYQTEELAADTLALVRAGCAEVVYSTIATAPRSRTLPGLDVNAVSADIVRIGAGECRL